MISIENLNFIVMPISEESDLRFNSLKSQFDANKSRLEKELTEAKKENAELQQKVSAKLCRIKKQSVQYYMYSV